MKKSLFLCALLGTILLAGCSLNQTKCPKGSEYWETRYDNGNLDAQGCFKIDSDVMEGHWVYYYEDGTIEMEGDIVDDQNQGVRKYYEEDGSLAMEGTYKDDVENGDWKYYDEDGNYICKDVYANGELTDEGDCELGEESDIDEEVVEDETGEEVEE